MPFDLYYLYFFGSYFTFIILLSTGKLFDKYTQGVFLFIYALFYVVLVVFRDGRGYDYESYKMEFENDFSLNVDWSYFYISDMIKSVELSFEYLLLFYSTLSFLILYKILQESRYKIASLFVFISLYYLTFTFGQIRMGLAALLLLLGSTYLNKNQNIKFLILLSLATFIHIFTVTGLILLFLKKVNVKHTRFIFIILSLLFFFLIIFNNFTENIFYAFLEPILVLLTGDDYLVKKLAYYGMHEVGENEGDITLNLTTLIIYGLFAVSFWNIDDEDSFYFKIVLAAFILYGLFSFFSIFAVRFWMVFSMPLMLILPKILYSSDKTLKGYGIKYFILISCIYFYFKLLIVQDFVFFKL